MMEEDVLFDAIVILSVPYKKTYKLPIIKYQLPPLHNMSSRRTKLHR